MKQKTKILCAAAIAALVFLPFIAYSIKTNRGSSLSGKNFIVIDGYVSAGDVLGNVLAENGVTAAEAHAATQALRKVFDVRRCNIGDRWEMYFDGENNFVKFIYYDGPMDYYIVEVDRENSQYAASAHQIEAESMIRGARGRIMSSLYESMSYQSVNPEIIIQFAEIFASKIDFFTDCRTDDEFKVLWDSYMDKDGNVLKDSRVSAASYTRGDDTYYAFYFETPDGKGGYYDENGKSVESVFLKAPLNYRRISSHFTYRRFHPILRKYRPHLGIDYAAPAGTPVSAIGDGAVSASGWRKDGLGITVRIKHPNGYVSWYGHLSRIAKGVSSGARVRKGQVVGYVGSTGMSTGPHLDFRIQKGGKFVNFLALKMPPSYPLPEKYLEEFEAERNMFMDIKGNLKEGEIIVLQNNTARKMQVLHLN